MVSHSDSVKPSLQVPLPRQQAPVIGAHPCGVTVARMTQSPLGRQMAGRDEKLNQFCPHRQNGPVTRSSQLPDATSSPLVSVHGKALLLGFGASRHGLPGSLC